MGCVDKLVYKKEKKMFEITDILSEEYIDGYELLEELLHKFIGEFNSPHHGNYIG